MRNTCATVFFLFLLFAGAGNVRAQEAGQVGVNLGYPLVGVTWHVTPTIAVRPEFNFSFGSGSSTSGSGVEGSEADAWGLNFGVSALFYLAEWDGVKGYLAPRVAFIRSNTESLSTVSESRRETSGSGFDLAAMAGVQYPLNSRFTVFGELGISYVNRHSESNPIGTVSLESDSWTLQPRTAIGLIVYF